MLTLSIQAGGQSTRMGQDKALLPFLGEPLIQRVLTRTRHLAEDIMITTNNPDQYLFLGVRLVTDIITGAGALGGLYTALKTAYHPWVGLVACDLPFANPDLLAACRDIIMNTGVDAVIPKSNQGLEPLHAVYRRDSCLPFVEAALKAEKRKLISWHPYAQIKILSTKMVSKFDPQHLTFTNVNTPEEFREAETKAREF